MEEKYGRPLCIIEQNENKQIDSIDLWHKIDGEWRHIFQRYDTEANIVEMYVDGGLVSR